MQYTNSLSEVAGTQHSILRDFLHLPSPPCHFHSCHGDTFALMTHPGLLHHHSYFFWWLCCFLSSTSFCLSVHHILILNTWPLGSIFPKQSKSEKIQNVSSKRLPEEQLPYIRFIYFFLSFKSFPPCQSSPSRIYAYQVCHNTNIYVVCCQHFLLLEKECICMHSCLCAWGVVYI